MSKKVDIIDVSSGYASDATLDTNFDRLNENFDNFLSLDGKTPNAMLADLDMNSQDINNANEINADIVDVQTLIINGHVTVPSGVVPAFKGAWATTEEYIPTDMVQNSNSVYICLVTHTAGPVFTDDLNAGYWDLVITDNSSEESAAEAAASAAAAAVSESNAATSETNAATSESNAAASAVAASASASNAAVSAAEAAQSAIDAAATLPTPEDYGASVSNTPAQNDTAFATMFSAIGDRVVDLEGKHWPVTAVPDGTYHNGYFKIENFQGAADVSLPQQNTLLVATTSLSHGLTNEMWPQDNACMWNEEIFIAYTSSRTHGMTGTDAGADASNDYARPVICRSRDGIHWGREEVDFGFSCVTFAHYVYGGMQVLCIRNNNRKHLMYSRQLAQRREFFKITAPSTTQLRLKFKDFDQNVMIKEGETITLDGLGTQNGVDLDREYTVVAANQSYIQVNTQGTFSSTFTDRDVDGELMIREGTFTEIKFTGDVSLGTAIAGASGKDRPRMVHGITPWRPNVIDGSGNDWAAGGAMMIGISGGAYPTGVDPHNCAVARVNALTDVNGEAECEWVNEIPGALSNHTEPTICMEEGEGGTKVFGFARTQSVIDDGFTTGAGFWHGDVDGSGLSNVTFTMFPLDIFEKAPIACDVVGDYIVGFANMQREYDRVTGTIGAVGKRDMALLVATKADAIANGASAFEIIKVGEAEFKNLTFGATGVGVTSMTKISDNPPTVAAFYASEAQQRDPYRYGSTPQIMAMKIGLDANAEARHGPAKVAWGTVPAPQWSLSLRGAGSTADPQVDGDFLQFDNIDSQMSPVAWDRDSGADLEGDNDFFHVPVSGRYLITAQIGWEQDNNSSAIRVNIDGATPRSGMYLAHAYGNANAAGRLEGSSTGIYNFRAGQRIRFEIVSDVGPASSTVRHNLEIELLDAY